MVKKKITINKIEVQAGRTIQIPSNELKSKVSISSPIVKKKK